MSQLMKGSELRETEQTECVAMQCLSLKRVDDESTGETLADPRCLGQIEVSAASPWDRPQPLQLLLIGPPELLLSKAAYVMNPAQDDQRADFEPACQAIDLDAQLGVSPILGSQDDERHQELGRHPVAPDLDVVRRRRSG